MRCNSMTWFFRGAFGSAFKRFAALALVLALPGLALADPPSRVARLAAADGVVSFSPAGDDEWVRASLNRPLVGGDRLWADADGRVEIQFSNATARMGATTSVVFVRLDDAMTQLQLTQGTLLLRVRAVASGEQFEVDTPNFAFLASQPGVYRFDVSPEGDATTLYVRSGEGDVYGDGNAYRIASGQALRFHGTDLRDNVPLAVAPPDALERWAQSRDTRYARLASARYVAPEVIGYEDLDAYGNWSVVANVGNVWIPRAVPAGWAPYRNGHWTWIDPWGWTWVDDAPWGFAPFHYGRWTMIGERWGWVPGPVRQRPVYAPALVAFVGGANFSISVATGPAIGWFPLAPGEIYRPSYAVTREYFTQVNVTNTVINTTYVTNVYNTRDRATDVRYAYREQPAAVTAVAPAAFAQAQSVQRAAVRVDRQALSRAEVLPVAEVAPQRESVTGGAPRARPAPARTMDRPMIAKSPPPPAPTPLETKLPQLREAPGKPLERPAPEARATTPPGQTKPASPTQPAVRVVDAPAPTPMPTAARDGRGERAAPERGRRENNPGGPAARAAAPATPPPDAPQSAQRTTEAQRGESQGPATQRAPAPTTPQQADAQRSRQQPQRGPSRQAEAPRPPQQQPGPPPSAQAPRPEARPDGQPSAQAPRPDAQPDGQPSAQAPRPDAQPDGQPSAQAPRPDARPDAPSKAAARAAPPPEDNGKGKGRGKDAKRKDDDRPS